MRTVYVNGEYLPENQPHVSMFDRGFNFSDAVYEVTAVLNGRLCDYRGHIERLRRSLMALEIECDLDEVELLSMHRELVRRNRIDEGLIYLQISRGVCDRDFAFPPADTPITITAFTQEKALIENPSAMRGVSVYCVEDKRWGRCDIKTVQLLYPSLAKMEAKKQGGDDAWFVKDGLVTEGASNNAYIITRDNVIVTRPLSTDILGGITRAHLLKLIENYGLEMEERAFSIDEAQGALEAFSTSASAFVMPVVRIDGEPVGTGKPGELSLKLRQLYIEEAKRSAI